ncbi:MAG: hypothetical protein Q4G36_04700 [Paracoccus sp. (in: a-proteobacteria)]|nr:hypothetical protein [Paracoccus sp. (in: a-proteobacteria)]
MWSPRQPVTPTEIVRGFWRDMNSNDFTAAARNWLAPDFCCNLPQTGEVIRRPEGFARFNAAFPGAGE